MGALLMSIKAEFIVNVGPYQHVAVTIEGSDVSDFLGQLDSIKENHMQDLGDFQAELESWVVTARQDALNGVNSDAVEAVQSLGATVIGTTNDSDLTDTELAMAITDAPGDIQAKALAVET